MTAWDGYRVWLEKDGHYRTTTVGELLLVMGKQRAGVQIVAEIEQDMAAHKIGHLPTGLPRDKHARVLVYNQEGPGIAVVMHLIRELVEGRSSIGATTDEQITMLDMLLKPYRQFPEKDTTPV
ncbi:hypothetical protein OH738_40790 (plasmid) [Streptomyces hirsutus]|uniref:hypothetical protein n=1 Tax=Streptomyces hirsutus TaxID=35620 RepID=UPI002F918926|nr:hypothetical protein OH738_40790 [Streptomyces hirsutus]